MAKSIGAKPSEKKSGSHSRETYQPDRGDVVHLNFSPHAGTEQAGPRPGLVLSPQRYNIATGLMFVCPITTQVKGSPWEVAIPPTARVKGCILSNQMRSLDWLARNAEFHSKAPEALIDEVLAKIAAIVGFA